MKPGEPSVLVVAAVIVALAAGLSWWLVGGSEREAGLEAVPHFTGAIDPQSGSRPVAPEEASVESEQSNATGKPSSDAELVVIRTTEAAPPASLPNTISRYYSLPSAAQLVEDPEFNPLGLTFDATKLSHLESELIVARAEDSRLASAREELVGQYLQSEFERGEYIELESQDGRVRSVGAPPGSTVRIKNRKDQPPVQLVLTPGEYPDLDAVKSARRELAQNTKKILESWFLNQESQK